MLMDALSHFPEHRIAITHCDKLRASAFDSLMAVLI